MDGDDKRKIHHPQGHENHGVHICHKCGWAFPNPHPSAKHRRAHKKVCGKIRSGEKPRSESDSDEDYKPSESVAQDLDEKTCSIVKRANKSEEEVFSDAVTDFADAGQRHNAGVAEVSDTIPQRNADTLPQPNNPTEDNKIQNHLVEVKPPQLDINITLQDHESLDKHASGASILDKDTNGTAEITQLNSLGKFLLSSEPPSVPEEPTNGSMGNPTTTRMEVVNPVAVVHEIGVEGHGEDAGKKFSRAETSAAVVVSSDFIDINPVMSVDCASKSTDEDLKVLDETVSDSQCEHVDASENQKLFCGTSQNIPSGSIDVEAVGLSLDHQVVKGNIHNSSEVEVVEATSGVPIAEELSPRSTFDLKFGACKDENHPKLEAIQAISVVEAIESDSHQSAAIVEVAHSVSVATESAGGTNIFFPSLQLQEDNFEIDDLTRRDMSNVVVFDQSAVVDVNEKEPEHVAVNSNKLLSKAISSHGTLALPDASKGLSADDMIIGLSEVDSTLNYTEDSTPTLPTEKCESHLDLTHVLPEASKVHVAGEDITVTSTGVEGQQEIAKVSGEVDAVRDVVQAVPDIVRAEYGDQQINDEDFVSNTQVTPQSAISFTETKLEPFKDAGVDKVKDDVLHDEDAYLSTATGSEVIGVHGFSLANVVNNHASQLILYDEASQTCTRELLVDTNSDPSSVKSEKDIKNEPEDDLPLIEAAGADMATDSKEIDANRVSLENVSSDHVSQRNEVSQDSVKELPTDTSDPSFVETKDEQINTKSSSPEKFNQNNELCQADAKNYPLEVPVSVSVDSESSTRGSFALGDFGTDNLDDGNTVEGQVVSTIFKHETGAPVVIADTSVDSISQTDSVECNWGSVSGITVPSATEDLIPPNLSTETESDINAHTPTQASLTDAKKQNATNSTDIFEAPSFMTLVEPDKSIENKQEAFAEIQSVQNTRQPHSPASQPGWFPSLTYVVNESQGRKKNEETISKVVNWSPKLHTPLRSLLDDADHDVKHKVPPIAVDHRIPKANDNPAKEDSERVSTVTIAKVELDREWNSPARMPVIKRERRKVKGYWAPFICCSSIK